MFNLFTLAMLWGVGMRVTASLLSGWGGIESLDTLAVISVFGLAWFSSFLMGSAIVYGTENEDANVFLLVFVVVSLLFPFFAHLIVMGFHPRADLPFINVVGLFWIVWTAEAGRRCLNEWFDNWWESL